MKITFSGNYKYKKVEFCCDEMGDLVMDQFIQNYAHSDHYSVFYLQAYKDSDGTRIFGHVTIRHCPFCGAKLTEEVIISGM